MTTIRSYVRAGETDWECDAKGAIRVGITEKYGGTDENRTAETLFTSAILTCLLSSFQVIATKSGLSYDAIEAEAESQTRTIDGRNTIDRCEIRLVIHNCDDRERAEAIIEKAERACTIKNSIRTTVQVNPSFS